MTQQAPHRALLILELAAIGHEIAFRQGHAPPHFSLDLRGEAPQIAPAHVALDNDHPLAILVADALRSLNGLNPRHLRQRNPLTGGRIEQQPSDDVGSVPVGLGQTHDDGESLAAVNDFRRDLSADPRFDRAPHVGDVQTITCQRRPIHGHLDLHRTGTDASGDVGRSADSGDDRSDFCRLLLEHRQAVAEHLDAKLRAHTRNRLVEAHRHRRRKTVGHARNVFERVVHPFDERVDRIGLRPLAGPEIDEHVAIVESHHLGCEFRTAQVRHDAPNLGKRDERAFDIRGNCHALWQRDTRETACFDEQGPLVELRHELGAQPRHGGQRGNEQDHGCADEDGADARVPNRAVRGSDR